MIPLTDVTWQGLSWQELIIRSVSSVDQLMSALDLPPRPEFSEFPVKVPLPYLQRIQAADANDPLLLQVLSSASELLSPAGYSDHPLEESDYSSVQGLIQKYTGRVLVITTGACAIHCRYCFRRHFPYDEVQPDSNQWQQIFTSIQTDSSIKEVILSGGDPLVMSDRRLAWILDQLNAIPHLTTVRIHSRLPMVIPNRVCEAMLEWVKASRLKLVLVNHINHANEIDDAVVDAMNQLSRAGIILLNQSVLLKGVNDNADALIQLSEKLFSASILPYYLHLLDPVSGAAHFDVTESTGASLMTSLRAQLPGYLVPKLVREVPGADSKVPMT